MSLLSGIMSKLEVIEKIEVQAAGERSVGNHAAADSFVAKANRLRKKYNLPLAPESVKAPISQQEKVANSQPYSVFDNFPGIGKPQPLTNERLAALRQAAADRGRPLTDAESAQILGVTIKPEDRICFL